MKIICYLAFLLLFQFSFCSDRALELPKSSAQPDNLQIQKRDNAVDANMVFRSTDGGKTWQNIGKGLPEPVKDIYVDRNGFFADDNGLYFTAGNGIYHSKPNATIPSWNKEIFPDEHSSIAPGKAGIYAYNYRGGGIFQKTNGTDVWSPVFTNFQEKRVFSVFETAGGTIFIGSDRGLFKSTNSGKSWKLLHGGGLGKMAESNGVLLATSQRGIIRSTDDGESWALVISEGGVGIDVERIEGGFAAINYSTVAKTRRIRTSYDGGKTWQAIDAGFPGQAIIDSTWRPINAGNTAQGGGADSGWHPKEAGPLVPEYKTSVIQVGENFFCGHTDGIYRSSDKGKTWKLIHPSAKGKMFTLSASGNVIYAIQTESHC